MGLGPEECDDAPVQPIWPRYATLNGSSSPNVHSADPSRCRAITAKRWDRKDKSRPGNEAFHAENCLATTLLRPQRVDAARPRGDQLPSASLGLTGESPWPCARTTTRVLSLARL
jgi:hypothetical protein